MAADAIQFRELRVLAHTGNPFCEFALLFRREQDIGTHTDHERAFELQPFETGLQ